MEAQRAGASLDLGQSEALFNQSVAQVQNQLRQQALMNRLAMSTAAPAAFGLQQQLFGQRLAAAPRSNVFSGVGQGSQFGYGLSGSDVAGYGAGLGGRGGFFGAGGMTGRPA